MEKNNRLDKEEFFRLCMVENYDAKLEICSYVRCKRCRDFLGEPLYCITCNSTVCKKCHKNCGGSLHVSRHLRTILEDIRFKCKFDFNGCKKELNYFDLGDHISKCPKKTDEVYLQNNNGNSSSVNYKFYDENFDMQSNPFFFDAEKMATQSRQFENKKKLYCDVCEKSEFDEILDLIEHKRTKCKEENISKKFVRVEPEKLNKDYLDARQNYFSMLYSIGQSNLEILLNFFGNYNEEYNKKKQKILELLELESISKKNIIDNDVEDLLQNDEEYKKIEMETKILRENKLKLEQKLDEKLDEIQDFKNDSKKMFQDKHLTLNKKLEDLTNLEMNLNLLISEIQPGIVSDNNLTNSTNCGNCGNNKPEIKKIICEECKTFYCENVCISYCASEACKNKKTVVCKTHTKTCGLCDRANYCEVCLKHCYYKNCQNRFCISCYRRNEHQARNPEFNCKFFTCEKCQISDCIMTSLFCQRCEQRLCKKCVKKDNPDHFPFLKNK